MKKIALSLVFTIISMIIVNAQTFQVTEMTNPDPLSNVLNDIYGVGNKIFAVGGAGTILSYDGTNWTKMTSNTSSSLSAVWASSENNAWAVGVSGTLLHYNGISWDFVSIGESNNLKDVFGFSENDIYICGSNETMYHYDGSVWSKITTPAMHIHQIFGTSNNDVYITAINSDASITKIYLYDGANFTEKTTINDGNIPSSALWSPDNDNYYFSGNSAIYKYNKTANSTETIFNGTNGNKIMGDNNNLFVGGYQALYHFNGTSWTQISNLMISSIFIQNTQETYAVGANGKILKIDLINSIKPASTYPELITITNDLISAELNEECNKLEILDISGKSIIKKEAKEKNISINFSSLSSGVYIIKANKITKKFIKK